MREEERRYYGFDALRGAMMMLGIVLHASEFYLAAPPPTMPLLQDRNTSYLFDVLFHFIHSFRMPLFFVLAGFFASLLVARRGLWGTYRNRAARVFAPLLAGLLTVVPVAIFFFADFMIDARFGTHAIVPDMAKLRLLAQELQAAGHPVGEPSPLHLWFLYYLLYFYLLIPLCRMLAARIGSAGPALDRALASPLTLVALGLYAAATLWPFRAAQVLEGFLYFKPHLPSLLYYGSFFVFGYLMHARLAMLQAFVRHLRLAVLLAAVSFPASLALSALEHAGTQPAFAVHLAACIAHGLCTWALIYAFAGSALRFFDYEAPWILYVSQSSYWIFLLHLPVVIFASWWLLPFDLPAFVKFLAATAFTTLVCFLSYHYWVQRSWMSAFLNGRRFDLDWPWRAARRTMTAAE